MVNNDCDDFSAPRRPASHRGRSGMGRLGDRSSGEQRRSIGATAYSSIGGSRLPPSNPEVTAVSDARLQGQDQSNGSPGGQDERRLIGDFDKPAVMAARSDHGKRHLQERLKIFLGEAANKHNKTRAWLSTVDKVQTQDAPEIQTLRKQIQELRAISDQQTTQVNSMQGTIRIMQVEIDHLRALVQPLSWEEGDDRYTAERPEVSVRQNPTSQLKVEVNDEDAAGRIKKE